MAPEEAWSRVARECPRRILGVLHRSGEYQHGTSGRFPGKVLCCHRDTPLPEDWAPTPAQAEALEADGQLGGVPGPSSGVASVE
jgi:hypothetical protein